MNISDFRIVALVTRREGNALRFRKRGEGLPPQPFEKELQNRKNR